MKTKPEIQKSYPEFAPQSSKIVALLYAAITSKIVSYSRDCSLGELIDALRYFEQRENTR